MPAALEQASYNNNGSLGIVDTWFQTSNVHTKQAFEALNHDEKALSAGQHGTRSKAAKNNDGSNKWRLEEETVEEIG